MGVRWGTPSPSIAGSMPYSTITTFPNKDWFTFSKLLSSTLSLRKDYDRSRENDLSPRYSEGR